MDDSPFTDGKICVHQARTRYSDMDTQRHVTSRTYEALCYDGRVRYLQEHGVNINRMIGEQGMLPVRSEVRFLMQQKPDTILEICTRAGAIGGDLLLWDQQIRQMDGQMAAQIRTLASLPGILDYAGVPRGADQPIFPNPPAKRHSCQAISWHTSGSYMDRDVAGIPYIGSLWGIFENARWHFAHECNLSLERFIELDATLFRMGGRIDIIGPMRAGEQLRVDTWIRNLMGVRVQFCQEIYNERGDVIMTCLDDQVCASLSKQKPRRHPPEFVETTEKYNDTRHA